jgi:hypothetical protein
MSESSCGIVYVLTNSAMPGLSKIGMTSQEDIQTRMGQLYSTGVPVQFDCVYACKVRDCATVEAALHHAFGNTRVNPKREFFQIEPERVVSVLRLLAVEDVTPQVEEELSEGLDAADKESRDALARSRRPPINFGVMKIPVGAVLTYRDDDKVQVKVVDDRHVEYNGVPCSLTRAHREIFKLDYNAQPTPFWAYNGKSLKEIYDETYATETDA